MAGALRNTMVWLGFAEDERDREDYYDDEYDTHAEADDRGHGAYRHEDDDHGHTAEVTQLRRTPVSAVVRDVEVGGLNRITTIHPRTYNEAKAIGESFRDGVPVIMNLSDMDDGDAKRLVDFAAGLVFGLHGTIERVTSKVFLLSPATIEVATQTGQPSKNARVLFNQS